MTDNNQYNRAEEGTNAAIPATSSARGNPEVPSTLPHPPPVALRPGLVGVQRIHLPRRVVHSHGNLLRENITSVIRGFQPFMNTARSVNPISLSHFLSRSSSGPRPPPHHGNSVVINVEGLQEVRPPAAVAASDPIPPPPTLHNGNNNNNHAQNHGTTANAYGVTEERLHELEESGTQFLKIVQKYLPFVLILLIHTVFDHRHYLAHMSILVIAFVQTNRTVKQEAIKQQRKNYGRLLLGWIYCGGCIAWTNYFFLDKQLYLNLILVQQNRETSVLTLLWLLVVADFVLKLFTITVKIGVTMLPLKVLPHHKRGNYYLFIEAFSQLYRGVATVQPWLIYLLEYYQGTEKILGVFLSAIYMVAKGGDLMSAVKLFANSGMKLLHNVSLGLSPTKEQIHLAGNICPICHDDYNSPVLLQCQHIFCEGCVSTWFDREPTCPLCRAKIVDDPSWRDGSTSLLVQLF